MKREILFVSSNFPPVTGGSSVVYDQLCRHLADEVVALGPSRFYRSADAIPNLEPDDAGRGYQIYRIPFLRPPLAPKRPSRLGSIFLDDMPILLKVLIEISKIMFRHGCKVICIGDLVANGWLVFPLRYLMLRRVILYTHGEEVSQDDQSLSARLRSSVLLHAHAIVAVSDFCKGQVISKYGVSADKIFVVPNGVDLSVFSRGPSDYSVVPPKIRGKRIILSVSRLVERKGQDKLIEAMTQVVNQVPDAHCVLVGDGPLARHLRQLVIDAGMTSNITFTGPIPLQNLVQWYRSSELFVLPCRTLPDGDTEGFGLVFLEANACGLPVVAGAAGGTVEAVADGETGVVVESSDVSEITGAILALLNDPARAKRLADTGWRLSQAAGWETAARKVLDICHGTTPPPAHRGYHPLPEVEALVSPKPDDTPARLLMTVDLEEQFDWNEFPRTDFRVHGVDALAEFHESCRTLGVSPVYLATYSILENEDFRRFLSAVIADGSGEVGIHLHAWNTPPNWEFTNSFNSFQCNLPRHVERRKLEVMCRRFEEAFGRPARIHRAGRWGGSDRTADLLEELGLQVDLSPCPDFFDRKSGGPDFRNLHYTPFWAGAGKSILVIPASTSIFLRGPERLSSHALNRLTGVPFVKNWIRTTWGTPVRFTPEGQPTARLLTMARRLSERPVSILTLHSTSLYAGGNPYVAGPGEAKQIRERCLTVLRECASLFQASTCEELRCYAMRENRQIGEVQRLEDVFA